MDTPEEFDGYFEFWNIICVLGSSEQNSFVINSQRKKNSNGSLLSNTQIIWCSSKILLFSCYLLSSSFSFLFFLQRQDSWSRPCWRNMKEKERKRKKIINKRSEDPIFFPILAQAWLSDESNFDSLVTPGLDWTRIFISLTAGAGTR